MHQKNEERHMIDVLFVLTLFLVFAFSALTLVSLGASIYQKTVDHMNQNFNTRTSYAYITQRIREFDEKDSITIGTIGDEPAVLLKQEINDTIYFTYLYQYDGKLCELLTRSDMSLEPSAGTPIMDINDFQIEKLNSNLYRFDLSTADEIPLHLLISTRAESEVDS